MVQLTDLHISRLFPAAWTKEVVLRTNALDADLIVITGDFIDGDVAHRKDDVAPLSGLRARDGVYAIPGNHEYFFDYQEWMGHLEMLGMRMLSNSHLILEKGNARIVLAGVTDLSVRRHSAPPPDLAAAIKGAPANTPILLLDHQPMMAEKAAASGVALQLSGHTHGGMVHGLDRLIARANGGFVSGRYQVGAMTLYVNNGTALWPGFALRLGVPSELTKSPSARKRSDRQACLFVGFAPVVEESAGAYLTGFRGCESGGKTMPQQPVNHSVLVSRLLPCCVLLHLIESRLVRLAPLVEHFNRREGPAKGRQFIFHLRRYDIVNAPMHKARCSTSRKV